MSDQTYSVDVVHLVPMLVVPGALACFSVQPPWTFELGGHGGQFLVIPHEIAYRFEVCRIVVGNDDLLTAGSYGSTARPVPARCFVVESVPSVLRGVIVPYGRQVSVWVRNISRIPTEFSGSFRGRRVLGTAKVEEVEEVVRVRCFCGRWFTVGETDRGPALFHATPACDRFLETPIDQFLHDIRVHWETHAAPN